jgi:hypothetical protein
VSPLSRTSVAKNKPRATSLRPRVSRTIRVSPVRPRRVLVAAKVARAAKAAKVARVAKAAQAAKVAWAVKSTAGSKYVDRAV